MSFGFGGEEPRPCSPRAYALAAAVLNVTFADAELRAAKAKVPSYTGQWLDSDYYADQTDAYYRAAEALEQALVVDHTDKLALGAKFVPSAEQGAVACPFCASTDTFVERADFSSCYVTCNDCGARGPTSCDETDGDVDATENGDCDPGEMAARRLWSRRASAPPVMTNEQFDMCRRVFLHAHSDGWTGNQMRRDVQHVDAAKSWELYVKHGALAKVIAAAIRKEPQP